MRYSPSSTASDSDCAVYGRFETKAIFVVTTRQDQRERTCNSSKEAWNSQSHPSRLAKVSREECPPQAQRAEDLRWGSGPPTPNKTGSKRHGASSTKRRS